MCLLQRRKPRTAVICLIIWEQVIRTPNQLLVSLSFCVLLAAAMLYTQHVKYGVYFSGREFMWECRGTSLETLYLCESCQEIISFRDICPHMISMNHGTNFLVRASNNLGQTWGTNAWLTAVFSCLICMFFSGGITQSTRLCSWIWTIWKKPKNWIY